MDAAKPEPDYVVVTFADSTDLQNAGESVFRANTPDERALLDEFEKSLPVGLEGVARRPDDPHELVQLWRGVLDDDYDSPKEPFTVPTYDGGESTFTPLKILQLRAMRVSRFELKTEREAKRAREPEPDERAAKRRRVEPFLGPLDRTTLKASYVVIMKPYLYNSK